MMPNLKAGYWHAPNREIFPNWLRKSPQRTKNSAPPPDLQGPSVAAIDRSNFGKPCVYNRTQARALIPYYRSIQPPVFRLPDVATRLQPECQIDPEITRSATKTRRHKAAPSHVEPPSSAPSCPFVSCVLVAESSFSASPLFEEPDAWIAVRYCVE